MFINRTAKLLLAVLAVMAIFIPSVALGAGEGESGQISYPGGPSDRYVSGYMDVPLPWDHNVVIVHVGNGKGDFDLDIDAIAPNLAEYASGQRPYLVDFVISASDCAYSFLNVSADVFETGVSGWCDEDPAKAEVLEDAIGFGLSEAIKACSRYGYRHYQNLNPSSCDIVLITHEIPDTQADRVAAMVAAMDVVYYGYRLHTMIIDQDAEVCTTDKDDNCELNPYSDQVDQDHVNFNQLLGAKGVNVVSPNDNAMIGSYLDQIINHSFWVPTWYPSAEPGYYVCPGEEDDSEETAEPPEVYDPQVCEWQPEPASGGAGG